MRWSASRITRRCSTAPVFGGVEMDPQERALKAGVDIVVATPGTADGSHAARTTDFVRLQVLVLDEADRMMDMGFWPDVQRIMAALPPDRQTLLFSATLPGEILRLARDMLHVAAATCRSARKRGAARTIKHSIERCRRGDEDRLAGAVRASATPTGPVLVFVRTKIGADRVARQLQAKDIRAAALHADRTQQERLQAVEGFRSGKHPGAGRDRHRRARPRHRRHRARRQFRSAGLRPRPTCTASAARGGRAQSGHAMTLVSPNEQRSWRAVESSIGFRAR